MNYREKAIKILKLFYITLIIILLITCYIKKVESSLKQNFQISLFYIESGSMMPHLKIGDVVLTCKKKVYKEGEIITYIADNSYFITHRIIKQTENGYITKGDSNNTEDENIVMLEQIEGKVIFHSSLLGKIIEYRFYIIGILIFLLLI